MFNKTFLLEKKYNWDGICIEANPIYYQHLINNRKVKCLNYCVDHENDRTVDFLISGLDSGILFKSRQDLAEYESVIKLKTKRLETILMELNAPKEIDYLSIDVEGGEERILLSFPFSE